MNSGIRTTGFVLSLGPLLLATVLLTGSAAYADDEPSPAATESPTEPVLAPPIVSPPVEVPTPTIPEGDFAPPVEYPQPTSEPYSHGTLPDGSPVYEIQHQNGAPLVVGAPMGPVPDSINDFVMSHPNSAGWSFLTMPDGTIVVSSGVGGSEWVPLSDMIAASASGLTGDAYFDAVAADLKLALKDSKVSGKSVISTS